MDEVELAQQIEDKDEDIEEGIGIHENEAMNNEEAEQEILLEDNSARTE